MDDDQLPLWQDVDQPVPVGFSEGNVTGAGSAETAQQFLGFWKNFIDAFGLSGAKTYITGVSYAGVSTIWRAGSPLLVPRGLRAEKQANTDT